MNVPLVVMWSLAGALWVYALVPMMRLRRYLDQQKRDGLTPQGSTNTAQIRAILRDTRHPLHPQARRMMAAYGGFFFFWIAGFGLSLLPATTR